MDYRIQPTASSLSRHHLSDVILPTTTLPFVTTKDTLLVTPISGLEKSGLYNITHAFKALWSL